MPHRPGRAWLDRWVGTQSARLLTEAPPRRPPPGCPRLGRSQHVHDQFTLGVEEEFLTVDPATFDLRPRSHRVLDAARDSLGAAVQPELTLAQVEIATGVCTTLDDV